MYDSTKDLHDVARSLRGILDTKTRDLRSEQYDGHFIAAKKALTKYDDSLLMGQTHILFNRDDILALWTCARRHNSTIPDDRLDQMRNVLLSISGDINCQCEQIKDDRCVHCGAGTLANEGYCGGSVYDKEKD